MSIDKKYVERICKCIALMDDMVESKIYLLRLYARGRSKEEIDFIDDSIKYALSFACCYILEFRQ